MKLTHSFQGRFLIVAAMLGVALLVIVFYTKKLVRDDYQESKTLIAEYIEVEDSIGRIHDLYLDLKSSLYQYTLLLTPELKAETLNTIKKLKERCKMFKRNSIVNRYVVIRKYLAELEVSVKLLSEEVEKNLKIQENAETRYPAVKILLEELQPSHRKFIHQLSLARDEADDLRGQKGRKIVNLLNQVRYYWAKRISQVRLFIVNRQGIYGAPETVLPQDIEGERIYAERLDFLLAELHNQAHNVKRAIILREALDEMIATSRRYSTSFKNAVDLFMKSDWRADVYFMESRIEPLINRNQNLLQDIEQALSDRIGKRIDDSVRTSGTVSAYIWWFLTFVYFLIMIAYYVFEKSIRKPLYEVAMALEAQGKNESYPISKEHYYVSESEILIDAFEHMKEQVDNRQLRLQSILQNVGEGIVITDRNGIVDTFNPAAEQLFGMGEEEVKGQTVENLLGYGGSISGANWRALMTGKMLPKNLSKEIKLSRHDGQVFYISVNTSSMIHQGETYYIAAFEDISERKALTDRLQCLADMDCLTELYNRRYFIEELDRLVERSIRKDVFECAILFIDLDNFKTINDTHGHHVGDRVLAEVSSLMKEKVRKSDLLARLGGDEFVIILYDVDAKLAKYIAGKYQALISGFSFYEKGKMLDVGCTIGVAMMDDTVKGKDDLLTRADYACQMAKQLGRNRVYLYSNDDDLSHEKMLGHIGMAEKIKNAIESDAFRFDLQPIRSIMSGEIYYHEILLRMIGDDGKNIQPSGFLPAAERFDLMVDIDRWVIRHAIELLSKNQQDYPGMKISINLSAQTIGHFDIIKVIDNALTEYNVPAASLLFEITEIIAISHMETASQLLQHLRNMGCKTVLDDFGTGYSSYSYLKELPADIVKIDGAFIKDIDSNELNYAMVKSMHEIAQIMGKKTIAECVENEAVLNLLRETGVDYVQGSYLGKPSEKPASSQHSKVVRIR